MQALAQQKPSAKDTKNKSSAQNQKSNDSDYRRIITFAHAVPGIKKKNSNQSNGNNTFAFNFIHNLNNTHIFPELPDFIQPKLNFGQPNDKYEEEADKVAENVIQVQESSPSPKISKRDDEEEEYQVNPLVKKITPLPQSGKLKLPLTQSEKKSKKFNGSHLEKPFYHNLRKATQTGGMPLSLHINRYMSHSFGTDFSHVRIYNNPLATKLNNQINSQAFTIGNNIYFNQGKYSDNHNEGKKLLAHELTHVVQQTKASAANISSGTVQAKGTIGGFFRNIGRAIANIFVDELKFSDQEIDAYLKVLKAGSIEDDYISDDKARAVVRRWKAGKQHLDRDIKLLLIKEMFSGATFDDDEKAILELLKGSPGELTYILSKIKPSDFRNEFHGREKKELEKILKPWEERTGNVKSESYQETKDEKVSQTKILGDDDFTRLWKQLLNSLLTYVGSNEIEVEEGMTLLEFDQYIHRQADWFTEPDLQANENIRNKLWEIAFLLGEGNHISTALGKLKMAELIKSIQIDKDALRWYAKGADNSADMVRITDPHDDYKTVIKWGNAMHQLHSFVPGPVLKKVIDQSTLQKLITLNLISEFKKYYQIFTPTIEHKNENYYIITLLIEGITPYLSLKGWVHDLHIVHKETRLQLVQNILQTNNVNKTKPVLLILMSGLDHNTAFLQWQNLKSAVKNTKNLTLVIQGEESINALTIKVIKVAKDYGLPSPPDNKPRLGQVVIAGHGQATSVEQATTGVPSSKQKSEAVQYQEEPLHPKKTGDDSIKLIDTILQLLDPKDARIVFAGCLVGSHEIPIETQLSDTSTAARNINEALEANPNLRDIVEKRIKKLKLKADVQAANASTIADTFQVDPAGKAKLYWADDPEIGSSKDQYVQKGKEPEGALRAALETWADSNFGPAWTTNAMRTYVAANSSITEWWTSITRTGYEIALPAAGDVNPKVLNNLSHWISFWFNVGWEKSANAQNLAKTVQLVDDLKKGGYSLDPKNFPIGTKVYQVMLNSDRKNNPYMKVVVHESWMQSDPSKITDFLTSVETSPLKGHELFKFFKMDMITNQLPALLATATPTNPPASKLKLAITIAENMGRGMPSIIRNFLRAAAGGLPVSSFPAALNVKNYLDNEAGELSVLKDIDLVPGAAPETPSSSSGSTSKSTSSSSNLKPANANLDQTGKNESFISVQPKRLNLPVDTPVWEKPDPDSKVLTMLKKGTVVRVAGTSMGWAVIDLNGKVAYIDQTLVAI